MSEDTGLSKKAREIWNKSFIGTFKSVWFYITPQGSGFIKKQREDKDEKVSNEMDSISK